MTDPKFAEICAGARMAATRIGDRLCRGLITEDEAVQQLNRLLEPITTIIVGEIHRCFAAAAANPLPQPKKPVQ